MVEVTQADREAALALRLYTNSLPETDYRAVQHCEAFLSGKRDNSQIVQSFARHREAAEAPLRAENAELKAENARLWHVANDLLQHIDWLTNGLPSLLDSGGLTDEEGLIGAAVDTANSARAALAGDING